MPIARLTASLRNLALSILQLTGKPASPPCATAHDGLVGQSHAAGPRAGPWLAASAWPKCL